MKTMGRLFAEHLFIFGKLQRSTSSQVGYFRLHLDNLVASATSPFCYHLFNHLFSLPPTSPVLFNELHKPTSFLKKRLLLTCLKSEQDHSVAPEASSLPQAPEASKPADMQTASSFVSEVNLESIPRKQNVLLTPKSSSNKCLQDLKSYPPAEQYSSC